MAIELCQFKQGTDHHLRVISTTAPPVSNTSNTLDGLNEYETGLGRDLLKGLTIETYNYSTPANARNPNLVLAKGQLDINNQRMQIGWLGSIKNVKLFKGGSLAVNDESNK